jgi:putative Holliday junction resolvase
MPEPSSPVSGYLLAFDFGHRRIGVAVGQTLTRSANALTTLDTAGGPDWTAILKLVTEWKPVVLLVGLPLDGEGGETDMSRSARKFAAKLSNRAGIEVRFVDERLTSRQAESRFAELRAQGSLRRKDNDRIDAIAAQIILENWLQSLPPG